MFDALRNLLTRWFGPPAESEISRSTVKIDEIHPEITESIDSHPVPYDENLLERARTQWQFGDWESLANINRDTLQHHPDRAKLALLAAAGRLQIGNSTEARHYILLAQEWGVSKKLISRILIGGVHNSLGRIATIGNQQHRSLQHFKNAILIGMPGGAKELIANARTKHEHETMMLLLGSQSQLQQYQDPVGLVIKSDNTYSSPAPLRPVSAAHDFYIKLEETHANKPMPFLLIDSKSLPRSGLHFLKNTLSKILGDQFSFCEWYQEVGCCKQQPCALTGFANYAKQANTLRVRLTKSHDWDLLDSKYKLNKQLRRLILVRNPVYILTSLFALDQIEAHATQLVSHGIQTKKLWISHEIELISSANAILDNIYSPPGNDELLKWLKIKVGYINGFVDKWAATSRDPESAYSNLISYENINDYINELLTEYDQYLTAEIRLRWVALNKSGHLFKARSDPFLVESQRVSEYLVENADLFRDAALSILNSNKCWKNLGINM